MSGAPDMRYLLEAYIRCLPRFLTEFSLDVFPASEAAGLSFPRKNPGARIGVEIEVETGVDLN